MSCSIGGSCGPQRAALQPFRPEAAQQTGGCQAGKCGIDRLFDQNTLEKPQGCQQPQAVEGNQQAQAADGGKKEKGGFLKKLLGAITGGEGIGGIFKNLLGNLGGGEGIGGIFKNLLGNLGGGGGIGGIFKNLLGGILGG